MSFDVYVRISKEGDRTKEEVAEQVEVYRSACITWAKHNKIEVAEEEVETNVSGGVAATERKLERLILRVESGGSQGILTPDLERFSRDTISGGLALQRIIDAGGRLVGVNDGTDTAAKGSSLSIDLRLAVAKDYRARAREGFQTRIDHAIEHGKWLYNVPFGYRKDKDGKLERHPKEADIVVKIYADRAAGDPATHIAERYGLAVSHVRSILKSRVYLGEIRVQTQRKGEPRVVKNFHTPILTEPQWQAGQVKGEYHAPKESIAAQCKLAGIVHCGGCGKRCRMQRTGRAGAICYVCTEDCSARGGASMHLLDPFVHSVLDDAIMKKWPAVGAIIEGSTVYSDALAAVEEAQRVHDEYRDDVEAQEALGMKSWLQGLKVRADRVIVAREALTEARKTARPDWWQKGGGKKVTLAKFLAEDEKRTMERFIDRVVVHPSGRGTGKMKKLHERVDVYFLGDDKPYVMPAQKEAA